LNWKSGGWLWRKRYSARPRSAASGNTAASTSTCSGSIWLDTGVVDVLLDVSEDVRVDNSPMKIAAPRRTYGWNPVEDVQAGDGDVCSPHSFHIHVGILDGLGGRGKFRSREDALRARSSDSRDRL
jgi:hypothetical protein